MCNFFFFFTVESGGVLKSHPAPPCLRSPTLRVVPAPGIVRGSPAPLGLLSAPFSVSIRRLLSGPRHVVSTRTQTARAERGQRGAHSDRPARRARPAAAAAVPALEREAAAVPPPHGGPGSAGAACPSGRSRGAADASRRRSEVFPLCPFSPPVALSRFPAVFPRVFTHGGMFDRVLEVTRVLRGFRPVL